MWPSPSSQGRIRRCTLSIEPAEAISGSVTLTSNSGAAFTGTLDIVLHAFKDDYLGVRVKWTIRVTAEIADQLIRYETVSLPGLKTGLGSAVRGPIESGDTEVREVMTMPLGRLGRAALALLGKRPEEEVPANLRRLKQILETGRVIDTTASVPGKFEPRSGG